MRRPWPTGGCCANKRPGNETGHSASSAEVKNEWSHTSICLHALDSDTFVLFCRHDLNLRNVTT